MKFPLWTLATALLILGIALRFLGLGEAPYHHDEAIHAFFAGGFANYRYNPIYHGPLLYHLVAAVFGILGQHDNTARLVPALLGCGLLGLVLGPLRTYLGTRGALASAALLAVSPSMVCYSRHLLHDSLALFLSLGAVWCFLQMLEHGTSTPRGRNARVGLGAFLILFLATKANCFFIAVMLGAFYLAWRFVGLAPEKTHISRWAPLLLFAFVSATAILFPRDNGLGELIKTQQHALFQVATLLSCVLFGIWLLTRPLRAAEEANKSRWMQSSDATTYILVFVTIIWLYIFLFGNGAQILTQWAQTREFPSKVFSGGSLSARTAIAQMIEYWGGQQQKPRLPGRHDYYFVLMLLYEVPVLFAALGGVWHASKHRSTFSDLLLWWAFTSWAVYAVANEKVPWLVVHIVLPLALLGGWWLGQIRWKKPVLALAALGGLFFSLRGVWGVSFERAGDHVEPLLFSQTPEAFRDALRDTLQKTRGDERAIWLAEDRQWPPVWYLRENGPDVGHSVASIGGTPTPRFYRAMIGSEENWPPFEKAGWTRQTVDFLIWPRASWAALAPQRYFPWFWTRDALPQSERDLPQNQWQKSILSGQGEWSHVTAVIARP